MNRGIVMIGTGLATHGGIASVLKVYVEQGLLQRWDVRFIATHGDGSKGRKFGLAMRAWLTYIGLLLGRRVALLHVHCSSGPSFWRKFMFILPTFAAGLPVVLHWHGGGLIAFYRDRSRSWQRRLIRWTFERCRCVIALSNQWHDTLKTMFPAAHVGTIPNPVMVPSERASVDTAAPMVLFLGAVKKAKGVVELVCAARDVVDACPEARFVIAGTGDVEKTQQLAQERQVAHAVSFPGWVGDEERLRLLLGSRVFVLPSHHEAMPMSVLEAMAAGVPVVATRVGGIPLAVRNGIDGLLVEPRDSRGLANALLTLLGDAALRARMGAAARQRVEENFAADVMVPRIDALWQSLLPASAAPPGVATEDSR